MEKLTKLRDNSLQLNLFRIFIVNQKGIIVDTYNFSQHFN